MPLRVIQVLVRTEISNVRNELFTQSLLEREPPQRTLQRWHTNLIKLKSGL